MVAFAQHSQSSQCVAHFLNMYVSHLIGALGSGCDNARGIYEYPENIITAKGTNGDDDNDKNQGQ